MKRAENQQSSVPGWAWRVGMDTLILRSQSVCVFHNKLLQYWLPQAASLMSSCKLRSNIEYVAAGRPRRVYVMLSQKCPFPAGVNGNLASTCVVLYGMWVPAATRLYTCRLANGNPRPATVRHWHTSALFRWVRTLWYQYRTVLGHFGSRHSCRSVSDPNCLGSDVSVSLCKQIYSCFLTCLLSYLMHGCWDPPESAPKPAFRPV